MKNYKKHILTIILVIILIIILYFIYQFYTEYNNSYEEKNNIYQSNIIENNTNILQESNSSITESSNFNSSSNKTVIYEFTSADYLAAEGDPSILKIFEKTDSQIDFEFNHGWNFKSSTIDRKIIGTAKRNSQKEYIFTEYIDGHKYSLTIKFNENMVTLQEFSDEELISQINLWS